MINLFSILTIVTSVLSEETQEEADARILAEAKAYVSGLLDEEFEAWVVSMEKMGRFLEIAKIMRIEWLIERMQSLLPEAVGGMNLDIGENKISGEILKNNCKLFEKYWLLFCIDTANIDILNDGETLALTNVYIGWFAYAYATDIDKTSHSDTREVACVDAEWAYHYAQDIDQMPSDNTRMAACREARWAYYYAANVDKIPRNDTRTACLHLAPVANDFDADVPGWAYLYARDVDKIPRDDTRATACLSPEYAFWYAVHVDRFYRKDTRAAAFTSEHWAKEYAKAFGEKP